LIKLKNSSKNCLIYPQAFSYCSGWFLILEANLSKV